MFNKIKKIGRVGMFVCGMMVAAVLFNQKGCFAYPLKVTVKLEGKEDKRTVEVEAKTTWQQVLDALDLPSNEYIVAASDDRVFAPAFTIGWYGSIFDERGKQVVDIHVFNRNLSLRNFVIDGVLESKGKNLDHNIHTCNRFVKTTLFENFWKMSMDGDKAKSFLEGSEFKSRRFACRAKGSDRNLPSPYLVRNGGQGELFFSGKKFEDNIICVEPNPGYSFGKNKSSGTVFNFLELFSAPVTKDTGTDMTDGDSTISSSPREHE